jgi:hypothetical protein
METRQSMSTDKQVNTEAAQFNPSGVFGRPMDVVSQPGLTLDQKLAALQMWADTLQAHLAATSEGMQTPQGMSAKDVATLDEITKAQGILQGPPSST